MSSGSHILVDESGDSRARTQIQAAAKLRRRQESQRTASQATELPLHAALSSFRKASWPL